MSERAKWAIQDGELRTQLGGVWTCVNAEEAATITLALVECLREARAFISQDVGACISADDVVAKIDAALSPATETKHE